MRADLYWLYIQAPGIKREMKDAGRGPVGCLPSPSPEGSLNLQQLLAAFHASKRAANQVGQAHKPGVVGARMGAL